MPHRTVEVRYEQVVSDPEAAAQVVAERLRTDPEPLAGAFAAAHSRSVGRWRDELTEEQLAEVDGQAGRLLRELGYAT